MTLRLAVLASGTGSLLEAMIRQQLPISIVVTDRQCRALEIAIAAGIQTLLTERDFTKDFDRSGFTRGMVINLKSLNIDLIAMAGFMTIFTQEIFEPRAYQMRVLNTHPSLLPSFKGDHAVRDALAHGVKTTGCTVHWATEELDAGPIVAQEPVKVLPGDTVESLHERIKQTERILYPQIIRQLME